MLKTRKSIVLNSNSEIDGQLVVTLDATIPESTKAGEITQYIRNTELYEANRAQVRKDIAEFQDMVYAVEDSFLAEAVE